MELLALYILSVIVSVALYIYTNYDEGHDLELCVLAQMIGLGSIPILNIMIAVAIFIDNLDLDIDCSKIVLLKGKSRD